jgi:hypothetical protein
MRTPLLHAVVLAVSLSAVEGCSKSPGEHIYEATTAVSSKLLSNLIEKDASHQVTGLIAKLKTGPECDVYRRRLAEAGKGPPADGHATRDRVDVQGGRLRCGAVNKFVGYRCVRVLSSLLRMLTARAVPEDRLELAEQY